MSEKDKQEVLIWKFIDGRCTAAEKNLVEKWMRSDPSCRELYEGCLETHQSLVHLEPETPSVRFVQNVIDALPPMKPKHSEQLLPDRVWKWGLISFICILGLGLLGNFGIIAFSSGIPLLDEVSNGLVNFYNLPEVQYVHWIGIAVIAWLSFDHFYQRRAFLR
jgi:hypothetical protein